MNISYLGPNSKAPPVRRQPALLQGKGFCPFVKAGTAPTGLDDDVILPDSSTAGRLLMGRNRTSLRVWGQEQFSTNWIRSCDPSSWFNRSFLKNPSMFKENML
jgi:hypothetical protein